VCLNLHVEQLDTDTLRSRDLAVAWWTVCVSGCMVEGMKWITH